MLFSPLITNFCRKWILRLPFNTFCVDFFCYCSSELDIPKSINHQPYWYPRHPAQFYKTYALDDAGMKDLLWSAPHESEVRPSQSTTIISVPSADGSFDQYRMVQYNMMEAPLAAQYPHIRTFHGVSVSDPYKTIRADYTDHGFRAEIRQEGGHSYIDHFQRGDKSHKVVYYKKDIENVNSGHVPVGRWRSSSSWRRRRSSRRLCFRSYRLALATTAEYSNFHG